MSKTLPAAITAGKDGDSERVLLVRVIPESGDSWSEYDWATNDITVTSWEGGGDKVFSGGVLQENAFTAIRQSVDVSEGGNIGTISGLTINLTNPQFDSESRFDEGVDTYNFENRVVEIWLAFYTGSSPAYIDILLCYRGVIVDVKYDYGIYQLKIESASVKRHKTIPDLVLNSEDYPLLPDYNKGKVAPLLYGQLSGGTFYWGTLLVEPMILIEPGKGKYIASRNKMCSLGDPVFYLYHQSTDRLEYLYTFPNVEGIATYGRPTILQVQGNSTMDLRGQYYGHAIKQGDRTDPATLEIKNAIDQNTSTNVALSENQKLFVIIPIPAEIGELIREAAGNFSMRVYLGSVSGNPAGKFRYYNAGWDNGVGKYSDGVEFGSGDAGAQKIYDFTNDKSAHGNWDNQDDQYNYWTPEQISEYQWGIEVYAGCSAEIKTIVIRLTNITVRANYHTIFRTMRGKAVKAPRRRGLTTGRNIDTLQEDNICAWLQGEEFGSWLGLGRSDVYSAGDLIDSGVWHIEAILRSELGLGNDDINMDSFDVLHDSGGCRRFWPFASVIEEQKNSLEYIAEFCRNAGIIFFTDYQHKERVTALTKGASAVKTIDRTTIKENSIKVSLSPLDNVFNEFEITYGRHWVSGSYRQIRYCDASNQNLESNTRAGTPNTYTGLCADSQLKYNMTQKFSFVADWLSEQTEWGDISDKLLKWFAEWLCYRKWIVEFETAGLDHVDLELGDQVKIDHTLLPDAISNTAYLMLYDISHNLNNDRMKFKFIQIPDLLP